MLISIKKILNAIQINISNRNMIKDVIVPFFDQYPLHGIKLIAFTKIKNILELLYT